MTRLPATLSAPQFSLHASRPVLIGPLGHRHAARHQSKLSEGAAAAAAAPAVNGNGRRVGDGRRRHRPRSAAPGDLGWAGPGRSVGI